MTHTDGKPMPITDSVYGRNRRKPRKEPTARPARAQVGTLVRQILGGEAVADLYRGLGFTPPEDRPKRRWRPT